MVTSQLSLLILSIVIVGNVLLALFVYKNNPKSATNIIFTLLSLVTTIWLIFMYLAQPRFSEYLLTYSRLTIFFAIPLSVLFFLFAEVLPGNTFPIKRSQLVVISLTSLLMMAFNLSPFVFRGIEILGPTTFRVLVNPGMTAFALFTTSFSIGAIYRLLKKMKRASGIEKAQLKFVTFGVFILLFLIITTIMIPVMVFENPFFVQFAPLYVFLFLTITAYAIVKHRLLDIRSLLARTISFLIFIALFSIFYAAVLFLGLEKLFRTTIDIYLGSIIILVTVAASFMFQPVMRLIRWLTNRLFFQNRYSSDELLAVLTRIMARTIDIKIMAKKILDHLVREMHLTKGAFVILENNAVIRTIRIPSSWKELSAAELKKIASFISYPSREILFEDLQKGPLKELLRKCDIALLYPISVQKKVVALLTLGPKLSGEILSQEDLDFLALFTSEAGIAIQNAKSYEAIKRFSKELEKRVDERTRELRTTQRRELTKAQAIARLKDEFVFIASHELRTPVTAIRGFLELASQGIDNFPKDVQQNLRAISAASEHLNQLINDLLEISRTESGTIKISVEPRPLLPIIERVLQELSPAAAERRIHINLMTRGKIEPVLIDEKKMTEIVMNLLSNAIKYNREGGSVEINILPVENRVMLEVHDTGYGIPKDRQAKIFQKFFRATKQETQEVLGTGLGLFITRMLVEKMGGKIGFSSVDGKGSTFSVLLPRAKEHPHSSNNTSYGKKTASAH